MACYSNGCTENAFRYTHTTSYCYFHGQQEVNLFCVNCRKTSLGKRISLTCYKCTPPYSTILSFLGLTNYKKTEIFTL